MTRLTLFLILLLFSTDGFAAAKDVLSEQAFRDLATELAHKVNLFKDVWKQDPEAVFYGGTSRDYIYWLKKQFRDVHTLKAREETLVRLRALPEITVRDFIIGDSDVDVVSKKTLKLTASHFGVRKIDAISPEIFDETKEMGKNEILQGFVPAEKIRIGLKGLSQNGKLGDGVHEILSGQLSVHFADPADFAQSKFAKEGVNHPILLALRYLRLQAIDYFHTYGKDYPQKKLLLKNFDPKAEKEIRAILQKVLNSKELDPYLKNSRFLSWMNGTIQKAFRSYSNPTAALEYMKMFQIDQLPKVYGEQIVVPIYQYVFEKHHDLDAVGKNLQKFAVDRTAFFKPVAEHFPDGFFYHGTKREEAFLSILFQGALPSTGGTAGAGFYGVAEKHKNFAKKWGGSLERVLRLPVKAEAKIVDITTGEGERVWKTYKKAHDSDFEAFADAFGIDILKYPYDNNEAFVVKNSAVLEQAQSEHRSREVILALDHKIACAKLFRATAWNYFYGGSVGLATTGVAYEIGVRQWQSYREEARRNSLNFDLLLTKNTADFFDILERDGAPYASSDPAEFLKAYGLAGRHFSDLNPSADDVERFKKMSYSRNTSLDVIRKYIEHAKSPEDILRVLAPSGDENNLNDFALHIPFVNYLGGFLDHEQVKEIVQAFLRLNPSQAQATKLKALATDTEVNRMLSEHFRSQAKTPKEWLAAVYVPNGSRDSIYADTSSQEYFYNLDQFLALKPSKAEIQEFKNESQNAAANLLLLNKLLPAANSAPDYLEILSLGNFTIRYSTKELSDELCEKTLKQFLSLHPTVEDFQTYKDLCSSFKANTFLMKHFLASAKSPADFFKILDNGAHRKLSPDAANAVWLEALPQFLALHPSQEGLKALKKTSSAAIDKALIRSLLPGVKTIDDFFNLLSAGDSESGASYLEAMKDTYEKSLPKFLSLQPGPDDIKKFKQLFQNDDSRLAVMKQMLANAKSPAEFFAILAPEPDAYWEYKSKLANMFTSSVAKFLLLKPTIDDVLKFMDQSDKVQADITVLKYTLENLVKTPADYVRVMHAADEDVGSNELFKKFASESVSVFLNLNPTKEDLRQFLEAHFPKPTKAILIEHYLNRTKTFDEFFVTVKMAEIGDQDRYGGEYWSLVTASLASAVPHFLSLNPGKDDIKRFYDTGGPNSNLALLKQVLPRAKTMDAFFNHFETLGENCPSEDISKILSVNQPLFLSLKPSLSDLGKFFRYANDDSIISATQELLPKAKSIDELFELLLLAGKGVSSNSKANDSARQLYVYSVDRFLALHPQKNDFDKFKTQSETILASIALMKKAVPLAKSAQELLDILSPGASSPRYEYKKAIGVVLKSATPQFLKLHPSASEEISFRELHKYLESRDD